MKELKVKQYINSITKKLNSTKISNIMTVIFLLIISLIFSKPLLSNKVLFTHDGTFHVSRIIGTQFSIEEGQFLPVITSKWMNNFGYSWNLFYPPVITYIGVLLKPFYETYTETLYHIVFYLSIIACFSIYYLIKEITNNKKAAVIGSIIYVSAPYRITNIFVRMAIGEIISMSFLPVLFLGLYNLIMGDTKKHYFITIGAIFILLSHNISSVIAFFIAVVFCVFNIKKVFTKKVLIKLIINCLFIVGITSFFYIPLFESKQHTNYAVFEEDFMTSNEEMHKQSIHLKQLFIDNFKYARAYNIDDEKDHDGEMNFSIGYPIIVSLVIAPYILYKLIKTKKDIKTYVYFIGMGIFCLFLTTFYFPWDKMPRFVTFFQVPYRFLTPAIFLLSVQLGIAVSYYKGNINLYYVIAVTVLIIMYMYPYYMNFSYDELATEYPMLVDNTSFLACANFEYLPYNARKNFDYLCERKNEVIELEGNAEINNYNKNNTDMSFEIKNNSNDILILELPYTNYIGYEVKLNGEKLVIEESPNGLIQVSIPSKINGKVSVSYSGTKSMIITKYVSIISMILFLIYIVCMHIKEYLNIKRKGEVNHNE